MISKFKHHSWLLRIIRMLASSETGFQANSEILCVKSSLFSKLGTVIKPRIALRSESTEQFKEVSRSAGIRCCFPEGLFYFVIHTSPFFFKGDLKKFIYLFV